MTRTNITKGTALEEEIGFSRCVRVGNVIAVTATAPIAEDGSVQSPGNLYEQAKRCFVIIKESLEKAGGSFEDVIRTRMLLRDIADWKNAAKAHAEIFSKIQPACTFVQVSGFINPEWLIEVEVDCVLDE